ncbi:MAG: chemotaxis protein CheW [Chitinivibrionales bacterium]|nr:chemotaxis protein CheW [Chitinivibrionales bacterium]MBD3358042.1 chemotaxis protein CheW [Chitinivibrionales bacterium]
MLNLLRFSLDNRSYALCVDSVEQVVQAVQITPLPASPPIILGAVDFHGSIVPVLNVRRRFGLPSKAIDVTDVFIIARAAKRRVALVVDAVQFVVSVDEHQVESASHVAPGTTLVAGIVRMPDGMLLIHDLDAFLSLEEERELDTSLRKFDYGDASRN